MEHRLSTPSAIRCVGYGAIALHDPPAAPPSRILGLLARGDVIRELKLTPDQARDLTELLAISKTDLATTKQADSDPKASESRRMQAIEGAERLALVGILLPGQAKRLEQLLLQDLGVRGLLNDKAAVRLRLTKTQREELAQHARALDAVETATPALRTSNRKEAEDAMLNVLTPGQIQLWKRMLGAPLAAPRS